MPLAAMDANTRRHAKAVMESACEPHCKLSVPLVVEEGRGHNWDEAHKPADEKSIPGIAPAQILRSRTAPRPRFCGHEKNDEVESAKWREQQKRDGPQVRLIGKGISAPEKKRSRWEER